MFWKLIGESLVRPGSRRRALWAVLAVALGTAVASAMLHVSLDVGDKMGNELRSLGANIVITPAADSLPVEIGGVDYRPISEGAYIDEAMFPELKEIFWRNNIIAFAPYLHSQVRIISVGDHASQSSLPVILAGTWFDREFETSDGDKYRTGVRSLNPTWHISGEWPADSESADSFPTALVGRALAEKIEVAFGDTLSLETVGTERTEGTDSQVQLRVSGILTTGGSEDDQILVSLPVLQSLIGLPAMARKVEVSALITPEDDLSRRVPDTMTPEEYDRWYCSPYISSITYQIGEVLPGVITRQVRQVAETQGNVLSKLGFLMGMLAVLALIAAAMSISSLSSLAVAERRHEIGLMKALGAQGWLISGLFIVEAVIHGIVGGTIGFGAGQLLAQLLGRTVFDAEVSLHWLALPIILLVALGVSVAGTWFPVRRATYIEPATVLRGQ